MKTTGQAPKKTVVHCTTPDSYYFIPKEHRSMMCLLSDGTLFISVSHKNNIHVLAYADRLRGRHGSGIRLKYVEFAEVAEAYREFSSGTQETGKNENSTVQNQVVNFIREAVEGGASDLHIIKKEDVAEIKMRFDGVLEKVHTMSAGEANSLCATIYNSMCDIAQTMYLPDKPQDARLKKDFLAALGLKGARVATRPTDVGTMMVMRLLYARRHKATLEQLGYLVEQEQQFKLMAQRAKGVNIISGETGSGKSTTLETVLSGILEAADFKINVITVEDPPEYEIPGANQTPVQYPAGATNEEISQAWAKAISNLMRLDPDIGMVGEVRDKESAIAAFRLALTGHQVYTTLHANDAVASLVRLKDMGVDMGLLTDPQLVTGLINQSLAPKPCPKCGRPYRLNKQLVSEDIRERIERLCNPERVMLRGGGCAHCKNRGYLGRSVIAECVIPNREFMHQFRTHGKTEAQMYWVKKMGGITKNMHLIRRVNEGVVDPVMAETMVCSLNEDELSLE